MNKPLSPLTAMRAASSVLVDLDGCFLCGDKPAEGAARLSEEVGEKLFVISNNSTQTPEGMSRHLAINGLEVAPQNILLAGAYTIDWLARQSPYARIYLLGNANLANYARQSGLRLASDGLVKGLEAVVLARDTNLTYDKLTVAAALLDKGIPLIATNPDFSHPGESGEPIPETGSLLSAIKRVVPETKITIIGKPESLLFEEALKRANCSPHDAIMIGDNPATDLAGAARLGIPTYLIGSNRVSVAENLRTLLDLGDHIAPSFKIEEASLGTIDSPGLSTVLLQALENLGEAFVIWDHQDRLVHCNPMYSEFFDKPGVVVPGVSFSDLIEYNIEHKTVRALVYNDRTIPGSELTPEIYKQIRVSYHHNCNGQLHDQLPDGRWMQIKESRIPGGGIVGIYTDITARKEVEKQLARAKSEADEANKAKSRFLAAASHDLRQPLHAIGIFLSALESHLTTQEGRHLLHHVEECLKTTNNLFNSLLDISKLDAGVLKPMKQPCRLDNLLKSVELEFAPLAANRGITLTVDSADHVAESDPEMLGRIIRNFVSNAIKYTDNGKVLIKTVVKNEKVHIRVSDTGPGIRDKDMDLIFEEFKQLSGTDKRQQGLGLGLSIAARLAHLLGHTIEVQSRVSKGSCFSVVLPRGDDASVASEPRQDSDSTIADSANLRNIRVLIVEDNNDIRKASEILLRQWGCDVKVVNSYGATTQILDNKNWLPSLIITDYHLAGDSTGSEIVAATQKRGEKQIPVIIVTGDTDPDQLQIMRNLGCPIIHKPLQPMKLRALIQSFAST